MTGSRRRAAEAVTIALGLFVTIPTVTALVVTGLTAWQRGEAVRSVALVGTGAALTVIVVVLVLLVRNPPRGKP